MLEQSGNTYTSSPYAKAMFLSEAKVGKSCFMVASALGVLPWQKNGGIVDDPKNLHVVTFDSNALGGIKRFLLETCKAPAEALNFRVYNMQEDLRQVCVGDKDYNDDLYNTYMSVLHTISDRCAKGVAVLHISSLTALAQGLERAIGGPPGGKKGAGMDQAKWARFSHQMNEIRNFTQLDKWHCFWEAHIYKTGGGGQTGDAPKESLAISGKTGQSFPLNVEQVFRIRRMFGQVHAGSKCDTSFLDTRPSLEFIANGRNFTEALDPREADPTAAFIKLGLKVGAWGLKSGTPVTK